WSTNSSGNYVGNVIDTVSGSSSALENLEPVFQQDLNGDGAIGIPGTPDLIVSSLTPSATSVGQGSSLSFTYAIKNQGTATAGLNYEAWQIDSKPTATSYLGRDTVNSLAAGTTASFTDSISTSGLSVG